MSDGLNDARAMRIAEILNGYTAIQDQLSGLQAQYTQMDATTSGAVILRQCLTEGQILLGSPAPDFANPPSPGEGTKTLLQGYVGNLENASERERVETDTKTRIMLDAAARRFRAFRLFKRATCAIMWFRRRQQLLQGSAPGPQHRTALSTIDNTLRNEIIAVTDAKVFQELNATDVQAGNWTGEMPSLARIQQYIQHH